MKKAKTVTVANAYELLDKAGYSKMDNADRSALIKVMRPMRKIHSDFSDFRNDAVKRLRPDGFDKVGELIDGFNAMGQEERKAALADQKYRDALKANDEYGRAINDCLKEEADKEVELDFAPLGEETFGRLLDSNPGWSMGQALLLDNLLCKQ